MLLQKPGASQQRRVSLTIRAEEVEVSLSLTSTFIEPIDLQTLMLTALLQPQVGMAIRGLPVAHIAARGHGQGLPPGLLAIIFETITIHIVMNAAMTLEGRLVQVFRARDPFRLLCEVVRPRLTILPHQAVAMRDLLQVVELTTM
jgi:hypothetical protein